MLLTATPKLGVSRRETDVIDVASRHLNTMGVSLEWFGEIAKELGVSRPALYNYAVDRDELLLKCYTRSCNRYDAALDEAVADRDDPSDILGEFLSDICRPGGPEIAVLSEIDVLSPANREVIRARRDTLVGRLAAVIRQGRSREVFRPVDDTIVANAVLGMASWAPLYRRWASGAIFADGAETMTEILLRGLAADRQTDHAKPICEAASAPAPVDPFNRPALEEARRTTILIAASSLFNTRGLGATRVEDVGAAIGLGKRAIYHYIGDKASLIDACIHRAIRFYLATMEAAQRLPATRLEAYYGAVRAIVETFHDPKRTVMAPYVGSGLLSPTSRQAMDDFVARLTEGYRRILMDGQLEGSVRELPLDPVLACLPGVFSWAANSPPIAGADAVRVADELAVLTTRGILA